MPAPPVVAPTPQPVKPPVLPQAESFGSLHATSGPLAGNRFTIPKNGLMIGRDPTRCAIVLPSDTVSKEHAWVVPLDNDVAVIDRSSSNGTYVNSTDSARISKVVLKNGDRIFIGRKNPTEFTYFSS
jgi:pSer/pThr/pTyr-binding forkhead associated (FHA) protein